MLTLSYTQANLNCYTLKMAAFSKKAYETSCGVNESMKIIRKLVMLLLVIMFVISAWNVWRILADYQTGVDNYTDLEKYVSFEGEHPVVEENIGQTNASNRNEDTAPTDPNDTAVPSVDFETLSEINPDIVAWIYIEGTDINYPVVQGNDNSYYLNHLFDGTKNKAGCLFLDSRLDSSFADMNSVIYGHHLKNGKMFTGLMEYKKQEFYDEHMRALLLTPTGEYEVLFFSGYVSNTASRAWEIEFSDITFEEWLLEIIDNSCFESYFMPMAEDRVITLSTCTYEFSDARFVLHGIIQE